MIKGITTIFLTICLSGCATMDFDIKLGYRIYEVVPLTHKGKGTCRFQARLYAYLIKGKIFSNGRHRFAVKDGKIYDSMARDSTGCMEYTGLSINSEEVKEYYGDKETWKEIK